MQNDLISRSELLKWIPFWGGDIESMLEYITNMPTAYELEKVTEQLNVKAVSHDELECGKHYIELDDALEIVENGGKE